MEPQHCSYLLAALGLVGSEQIERVQALALLTMGFLFEQGFQFLGALVHHWTLSVHLPSQHHACVNAGSIPYLCRLFKSDWYYVSRHRQARHRTKGHAPRASERVDSCIVASARY